MVHLFAYLNGLKPGELILSLGNTHVYSNHIEALQRQCERTPTAFPTLKIREGTWDIDNLVVDDFIVEGYHPQGALKMEMAV